MDYNSLEKLVGDSIRAHEDPEALRKSGTKSVYALLVGAGMSLIQAIRLLKERDGLSAAGIAFPETWDENTLSIELLKSDYAWNDSPQLTVWSIGYFLNKSQQNLAAAFDTIINAWLRWRLKIGMEDVRADDWWVQIWPGTRLLVLKEIADHPPKREVVALWTLLASKSDERYDLGSHDKFLRKAVRQQLESYRIDSSKVPVPFRRQCALAVYDRINDFKHRIPGLLHRPPHMLGAELMLTITALRYNRFLFEKMLDDTKGLWRNRNSRPR